MNVVDTTIQELLVIEPKIWGDKRGFFYESFNARAYEAAGIKRTWVQDNHSLSSRNVLRGLHYQLINPQAKLVRVIRGEVYDVAVDIRRGSPTFGKWHGEVLSADNKKIFFIPEGFAHGFYTLSEEAEFVYKCSDYYNKDGERGIIWNDPELAIPWPVKDQTPIISKKDLDATWLSKTPAEDLPVYRG